MATDISICSNALLKLGAPTIASFNENTQGAQLCANIYTAIRDSVLRSHPWNCAIKRVALAPDASTPAWGYGSQFTIPPDCLRILEVEDTIEYRIESGKILCDESGINLRYIWRNTDVGSYDASLVEALTQRMVAELAYPITRSTTQQKIESDKYSSLMREARYVDATEQDQEQIETSPLITERYI